MEKIRERNQKGFGKVLRTRNQLSLLIESQNKQTKRENKDNQVKGKKNGFQGFKIIVYTYRFRKTKKDIW